MKITRTNTPIRIAAHAAGLGLAFVLMSAAAATAWQHPAPRPSAPAPMPRSQPRSQPSQSRPPAPQYNSRPAQRMAPQTSHQGPPQGQYRIQQPDRRSPINSAAPGYPSRRPGSPPASESARPGSPRPDLNRPAPGTPGQRPSPAFRSGQWPNQSGSANVRPGPQATPQPWKGAVVGPALNSAGRPNLPGNRPAFVGRPGSQNSTGSHLPDWMAQHRSEPVPQQERQLRNEPGFSRLNPNEQQRAIQQLHRIDQMPAAQRDRRLARAEVIERLSPSERMQVNQSARQVSTLPADRQAAVRRAFKDLRAVPVDQRQTMLNSARYSGAFNSQERGILTNLLRVEPYQPAQ